MIRFFTQHIKGPISQPALKLLLVAEYTATEYCKFILADVIVKGVRPSILAATAIHFGMQSAKDYGLKTTKPLITSNRIKLPNGDPEFKHDLKEELDYIIDVAWKDIILALLTEISDYSDIESFTNEVLERACYINRRYGPRLESLFKLKATRYFP